MIEEHAHKGPGSPHHEATSGSLPLHAVDGGQGHRATLLQQARSRSAAWFALGWALIASGHTAEVVPPQRDYLVRAWRKEHGLPEDKVLALLTDRAGFLWIGTRAGVARFDGQHFRVWSRSNEPAFLEDTCQALAEDHHSNLWVGTRSGLVRLGTNNVHLSLAGLVPAASATEQQLADVVTGLLVTRQGELFVGTMFGLRARTLEGTWQDQGQMGGFPDEHVTCLAEAADGAIWAGTTNQLYCRRPGQTAWVPQPDEDPEKDGVFALAPTSAGELWTIRGQYRVSLPRFVRRLGQAGWEPVLPGPLLDSERPMFLLADEDQGLWLPPEGSGLGRWANGTLTALDLLPATGGVSPMVACLTQGRDGQIWIGLDRAGLICLQPRRIRSLTPRDGLPHPNVWSLLEHRDGSLWVGTDGGAVRLAGDSKLVLHEPSGLSRNLVRALAEDGDGRVWIGTSSGLDIWDGQHLKPVRFQGPWFHTKIRCLLTARDGAVWIGTAKGLHRVRGGQTNSWFAPQAIPHDDIRVILEDRQGAIWVGSDGGGLFRFDSDAIQVFGPGEGLWSQRVWALCEDQEGWLWIGTDRGLGCLANDQLGVITVEQGLPVNLVNGIVDDLRGFLWVGHDAGIYRVRRSDLADVLARRRSSVHCIAYDEEDGMPALETNGQKSHPPALRLRDGRIAFATTAGVVFFDPAMPPDLTNGPSVRIEAFLVGGRRLLSGVSGADRPPFNGDRLTVDPSLGRQVEIQLAVAEYHRRRGMRLEHRLLGFDDRWYDTHQQISVSYPLVRPGNYTFEVRAFNAHGYASATPARLAFRIKPVWHEHWPVRIGTGLLLLAAVATAVQWRIRELRRIAELERQAALARERARLAKDLHDGLGASLTQITLLSGLGDPRSLSVEALADRFQRLTASTHEALHSLRNLIWLTNPRADSLELLLARICESVERTAAAAGLQCRVEFPSEVPAVKIGPDRRRDILYAVNEVVNNVVRHARARQVTLQATIVNHSVTIMVKDDGIGFDPSHVAARAGPDRGLGLASLAERLLPHGGTCEIHSRPGEGTEVILRLPLPK